MLSLTAIEKLRHVPCLSVTLELCMVPLPPTQAFLPRSHSANPHKLLCQQLSDFPFTHGSLSGNKHALFNNSLTKLTTESISESRFKWATCHLSIWTFHLLIRWTVPCAHVHMARDRCRLSSSASHLLWLSPWIWSLPICLDWLASKSRGSPCLYFLNVKIIQVCHHALLSYVGAGNQRQVLVVIQ